MQISEAWLRSFVDPAIDSDTLAERLTMAGLEVEESRPVAPPFTKVVVAHVLEVARHPNADRLSLCKVDAGTGGALDIVCGAPNVAAGMKVPCALEGAELPGGLTIRRAKVRGVESNGMLCSARELGLSEDHSGLMALASDAPVGRPVRELLGLDDRRIALKFTPNRGDCLSVFGVARELSAITGAPLCPPEIRPATVNGSTRLPIRIHAPDLCGRFSGRVIEGLDARAATPEWMRRRLEACGQRPISALVDISNYVMLELGRPSHVFDLDKVAGDALEVRWARAGEQVELLNGQTVTLDPWFGVIADARGVEAIAGIMGGEATAVSLDTTRVYVEAAFWWPEAIQGRTRRLGFSTDAAHRFERGTDYASTVEHIERITALVVEICGTPATRVGPMDDQITGLPARAPVSMRGARLRKVLGVPIEDAEIGATFTRLGLRWQAADGVFTVEPPSFRFDLAIEEDLIEEVARLWGFERLPALPPRAPASMRMRPESQRPAHALRKELAGLGYRELINFSFVDSAWERDLAGNTAPIRVLNPIAAHLDVMRSTLTGGLVQALRYNLNRQADRVRVFELGRVFLRNPATPEGPLEVAGIDQPLRLGGLAYGDVAERQWGEAARRVDFFDVKGDVERLLAGTPVRFEPAAHPALHPGRAARIVRADGAELGWIGELHPRWQQREDLPQSPVLFELDVERLLAVRMPCVYGVPRFPAVQRDLALWFALDIGWQAVRDCIANAAARDARLAALRDVRLFDVYRPTSGSSLTSGANVLTGKEKSLAIRLVLQDTERTLSEADADAAVAALVEVLSSELKARLRS